MNINMPTNYATLTNSGNGIIVDRHNGNTILLSPDDLNSRDMLQDLAEIIRDNDFNEVRRVIRAIKNHKSLGLLFNVIDLDK